MEANYIFGIVVKHGACCKELLGDFLRSQVPDDFEGAVGVGWSESSSSRITSSYYWLVLLAELPKLFSIIMKLLVYLAGHQ